MREYQERKLAALKASLERLYAEIEQADDCSPELYWYLRGMKAQAEIEINALESELEAGLYK